MIVMRANHEPSEVTTADGVLGATMRDAFWSVPDRRLSCVYARAVAAGAGSTTADATSIGTASIYDFMQAARNCYVLSMRGNREQSSPDPVSYAAVSVSFPSTTARPFITGDISLNPISRRQVFSPSNANFHAIVGVAVRRLNPFARLVPQPHRAVRGLDSDSWSADAPSGPRKTRRS